MVIELSLINLESRNFSLIIIIDKIRLSFRCVVLFISSCVFWFAVYYIEEDTFKFRFRLILLIFVLSINILIYSGSIFLLLVGWDGLGISSFALIIYYSRSTSLKAGYLTLLTNRIGDVLIIIRIIQLVRLNYLNIFPIDSFFYRVALLLSLASLTKRAQYPFRAWLPAAIAAPTPVSALVHSSTLVTAGVYLIIRLHINFEIDPSIRRILLFCGRITCLLGGLRALFENDIKKIIAFSTLRQLGLIIFCLGLNYPYIALLHLFTHAIFKALLFLRAGLILIKRFGNQDLRLLGSVFFRSPRLVVFFNVRRLCLMGAPFTRAFYSKHIIFEKIFIIKTNSLRVFLILIGIILTRAYSVRSLKILRWTKVLFRPIVSSLFLKNYLPLILLFIISIIRGKWFTILENQNLQSFFISFNYQHLLNVLLIIGVAFGIFLRGFKKRYSLRRMFFLWESSNKIGYIFFPLLKKINNLDYGWLEPASVFRILYKIVYKLTIFFKIKFYYSSNILQSFLVGLSLYFLCLYFY